MPRAMPVMSSAFDSSNSGPSSFSICVFSQRSSRACTASREGAGQALVGDDADARVQRIVGGDQLGHCIAGPAQRSVGGQHELIVRRLRKLFGARVDLAGQRLLRRRLQRLGIRARLGRIRREHESVETADGMALHDHFAGLANLSVQHCVFPQAPHQYTGPAINETLS
jgi:NAD(P)H-nitrite reductase large subunit